MGNSNVTRDKNQFRRLSPAELTERKNMKLKSVKIHNWNGKKFDFAPKKLTYVFHENGYGKSSLLNALRYAITGSLPKGTDIRDCAVEFTEADTGLDVYRERVAGSTTCKIGGPDGNKLAEKQLNAKIADISGVSPSNMQVISSSDIFSHMKPDDFLALLLEYLPEEFTFQDILAYMPTLTEEQSTILERYLCPDGFPFGISALDACRDALSESRKMKKTAIKQNELQIAAMEYEPTTRTLEEVEADRYDLEAQDRMFADNNARLKEYEIAKKKRDDQEALIKKCEDWLNVHQVEQPNPETLPACRAELAQLDKTKSVALTAKATAETTLNSLRSTLQNLDRTVCPISEKLVCTTDKTTVKDEISKTIAAQEAAQAKAEKEIEKAEARIRELNEQILAEEKKAKAYNNVRLTQEKIKTLKDTLPILPAKPVATDQASIAERRKALEAEKQNILNGVMKKRMEIMNSKLSDEVAQYTVLIDALAEKGPVKGGIIRHYVEDFESVCNAHAENSNGYRISFKLDNGVKVYATTPASKEPVYYMGLSSGEKIIVTFLVVDMLNSLTGMRMAFIDNLEQLDKQALEYVHKTITSKEFLEGYDHVFVCGVNNADVVEVFNDKTGVTRI